MPLAEADAQFACLLVEKQDGKDVVVNRPFDRLGDAHHELVQVKRRVDALGGLEQQGQDFRQLQRAGGGLKSFRHGPTVNY